MKNRLESIVGAITAIPTFVTILAAVLLVLAAVVVMKVINTVIRHLVTHPRDSWSWWLLLDATAWWAASIVTGANLLRHTGSAWQLIASLFGAAVTTALLLIHVRISSIRHEVLKPPPLPTCTGYMLVPSKEDLDLAQLGEQDEAREGKWNRDGTSDVTQDV